MDYKVSQALINLFLEVANVVASRLENTIEKKAANALAMLRDDLHFKPIIETPADQTPPDDSKKEGTE